jgi:hypothetical protein
MKFRKDITDYLISQLGDHYKKKDFKFYEQDGLLYGANYDYNNNKNRITHFTSYDFLWFEGGEQIKQNIEKIFNVKFSKGENDAVCKCGESKKFSVFGGDYCIRLRCNKCNNVF